MDGDLDFWCDVHDVFIARDLTRDDLRGVVRRGLATTRGSYRALLALFSELMTQAGAAGQRLGSKWRRPSGPV